MKVVMKSWMTGEKFAHCPGDVAEFSDAEATRLVTVGGARHLTEDEAALHAPEPVKKAKG